MLNLAKSLVVSLLLVAACRTVEVKTSITLDRHFYKKNFQTDSACCQRVKELEAENKRLRAKLKER